MHYLEDYMEIIDFLPAELKSRFLQMRGLDDQVQSNLDSMSDKCKTFFSLCRKSTKPELRDEQYQTLCKEYDGVLRDSSEKVKLANQVCDLLDRHMRRLDHDLNRFTIELEADTAGITELLEQRSYLLDRPPTPEKPVTVHKRGRHSGLLTTDDFTNGDLDDYSPSPSARSSPAPSTRYKYSRRDRDRASTLNLSTDVDSDLLDFEDHFSSPSSFYTGTGGKPPLSFSMDKSSRKRSSASQSSSQLFKEPVPVAEPIDWMGYVDPNEPRYCLCNQVSYGEMVGCDNSECTIEWFHYGCVGITEPPKGKWYCPQCSLSMKKKGRQKEHKP